MSSETNKAKEILKSLWQADESSEFAVEEDCSPTKSCKNMKDVTFDGYAEPGSDLGAAWRQKLAREGKLATPGQSIRDLVIGSENN